MTPLLLALIATGAAGSAAAPVAAAPVAPVQQRPRGTDRATQACIVRGLCWLEQAQLPAGGWSSEPAASRVDVATDTSPAGSDGRTVAPSADAATTGLVLLAFLDAGNTLRSGRHKNAVLNGVAQLEAQQSQVDGAIGDRANANFLVGHALATEALCVAYRNSRLPRLKGPAQLALDAADALRRPYGGWARREVAADCCDALATTCMVQALLTGGQAGLLASDSALLDGVRALGRVAADEPLAPATVAACQLLFEPRQFLGEPDDPARNARFEQLAAAVGAHPFDPARVDLWHLFFAGDALFLTDAARFERHLELLDEALVAPIKGRDLADLAPAPFPPPPGASGLAATPVGATALAVRCLEVQLRRDRRR